MSDRLKTFARSWLRDRGGQFAVILGILSPIALGVIGSTVDMIVFVNHRSELQDTADAAVMAVAQEATLKGWNAQTAQQVAEAVVRSNLTNKFGVVNTFTLAIDESARRVEITLDQDHYGYLAIGFFTPSPQIRVTAAALASAASTVCIIVQNPTQNDALVVNGNSKVKASGCATHANSTSTKSINVKDVSVLRTQTTCTAGGYAGKTINYNPTPLTDCPRLPDPLSDRAKLIDAEIASTCDYNKLTVKGGSKTLRPGTYCKGVTITDGAKVAFEPGMYVFKDSPIKVDKAARIEGSGVGLVFSGKDATLKLANDSAVSLSAPESGVMAGILIYGQPSGTERKFSIVSKDAQELTGTVYLPGDALTVGGDDNLDGSCDPVILDDGTILPPDPACIADFGTASDWTAIIANRLKVTAGSTLVMNTNYDGSSVPVPAGVGPKSARVMLAR